VEKAKDKIEKQQKNIMDSIHYAGRIQEAVLPPDEFLNRILGEHFVLFRPRDIVSGDFYWATQRGDKTVIVAADCTGHGVPGAFMSMLGISFLNEIVNKEEILQANIILNRLRENVKKSLRQTGKENEAKDGMDIALCIIDKKEMKIQYAGAYNPLLIIRNEEISRIKADRMPIGIYLREKESFTNNIIDIHKGDLLYIFSDGYVDQFGGETDSKIRFCKIQRNFTC
ncbi:MAG: SpoIIE family protein phosphatase, partial [Bacteroidales bacterium]|nr:SpoIIE family protein phosphatase [Bacteroidales bacterium]